MHSEGALNYKDHLSMVFEGFVSYPKHVKYFKTYFDDSQSIAKYTISKIRGGFCTFTSAAVEQTHSSNEVAVPIKIIVIVRPEE